MADSSSYSCISGIGSHGENAQAVIQAMTKLVSLNYSPAEAIAHEIFTTFNPDAQTTI